MLLRWRSAIEEARLLVADFARRDSSTSRLLGAEPATDTKRTGSGRLLGSLRSAGAADRFVMEPPALLPPIGSPAHTSLIRERTEGGLDIVMGGGAEAAATGGRFLMQPPALAPSGGVSDTGRILPPPRVSAPKGNRKMPVRTRVGIDELDGGQGGPILTHMGDGIVAPPSPVRDAMSSRTVHPQTVAANQPLPTSVNAVTGKATVRTSLTIAAKAERARKASCFEVGSRLSARRSRWLVADCDPPEPTPHSLPQTPNLTPTPTPTAEQVKPQIRRGGSMTNVVKACCHAAASSAGFGGSGSEDHMPPSTSLSVAERTSDASMDMLDDDDDDDMDGMPGGSPSPSRGGRPSTASRRKSVFEAPVTLDLMRPARTAPSTTPRPQTAAERDGSSSSGTPARPRPQSAGAPPSSTERPTPPVRMPSWRPPPRPPGAAPGQPSEGWAEGPSDSGGQ